MRRIRVVGRVVRVAVALAGTSLAAVVGYLGLLTGAAWWATLRRRRPPPGERHRYLIVIPAHDEERLIGATLDSLAVLDHPPDRYDVHVVADHCTDGTAEVVRAHGVDVHVRDEGEPGKGPALQWLLRRLADHVETRDAVVFVDADTSVDAGFLRAVDAHLAAGAEVVQGYYGVRDAGTSPVVAFRAAAFAGRNYLRPLGRTTIGGTAGLYGNGMVFRTAVLQRHGWSGHLTEDAELQLDLLLDGVKVDFAPAARVEAEMPDTLAAAQSQHERWERGRLDLARRYVPTLLAQTVRGGPAGRVASLDAALDQAVPPFSIVAAGGLAWAAVALLRCVVWPSRRHRRRLRRAIGGLIVQTVYVLSALRLVHAPAAVYRSLLGAPRMVAWKIGLWSRVLVRPPERWIRTARNEVPA